MERKNEMGGRGRRKDLRTEEIKEEKNEKKKKRVQTMI